MVETWKLSSDEEQTMSRPITSIRTRHNLIRWLKARWHSRSPHTIRRSSAVYDRPVHSRVTACPVSLNRCCQLAINLIVEIVHLSILPSRLHTLLYLVSVTDAQSHIMGDPDIFPPDRSPGRFPLPFLHGVGHFPLPPPPSADLQYKAIYR